MTQWNESAERARFEREMNARGEQCARNASGDYIDQDMYRAWIVWEIACHGAYEALIHASVSEAWNEVRKQAGAVSEGRSVAALLRAVEAYAQACVGEDRRLGFQDRGNG